MGRDVNYGRMPGIRGRNDSVHRRVSSVIVQVISSNPVYISPPFYLCSTFYRLCQYDLPSTVTVVDREVTGTAPPGPRPTLQDTKIPPPIYAMPDRPKGHHSSSSASAGALSFLPAIFGRRPVPPATSLAHASPSSRQSSTSGDRAGHVDELASPRTGSLSLPSRQEASPRPFHLDLAIDLMQNGTESTAELCEIVKATAVWLANQLIDNDVFAADEKKQVRPQDLAQLYVKAMDFASPTSDDSLRTAAIRLLAALLATWPPPPSPIVQSDLPLPDTINARTIYALIIAPSGPPTLSAMIDAVFVEVGALKALTKNGAEAGSFDGIVGWLVKTLSGIKDVWVAWCTEKEEDSDASQGRSRGQPFAPIKPASPADAATSIVELISSIVAHHLPLFTEDDLARIVTAILDFLSAGIAAEAVETTSLGLGSRRSSPFTSALNSPSVNALGLEPSLRQSVTANRSRNSAPSSQNTAASTPKAMRANAASPQAVTSPATLSPPPNAATWKWPRVLPAVCSFCELLISDAMLNDQSFDRIIVFACLCTGQDDTERMGEAGCIAVNELVGQLLGPKAGKRGEQGVRKALEGKEYWINTGDADRKILRGAVIIARNLLQHLERQETPTCSLSTLVPSLLAAQSTSRLPSAERSRWQVVDLEILGLLQDHLFALERSDGETDNEVGPDAWTEGEAACSLLQGLIWVKTEHDSPLATMFDAVIHQLPGALGRLHSSSSSRPPFYHPRYTQLLLDLGPHLDEADANLVVEQYQRECLCLPFTSGWIDNIWKLLNAFYLAPAHPAVKRKVGSLLLHDVFDIAEDLAEQRTELVERVIVPFLEQVLVDSTDEKFFQDALAVLVKAAVAETMERDDETQKSRAAKQGNEIDEEDAATLPSSEQKAAAAGGSFHAIRTLIIKVATLAPCNAVPNRVASPNLKGKDMQSISSALAGVKNDTPATPADSHTECRPLLAVTSLIAIFTRLAFSPPVFASSKGIRTPTSSRCIDVYRDLLGLLFPMTDDTGQDARIKIPARCPKARIAILGWLTRMRADPRHRIFMRSDIDSTVAPFAAVLKRTRESEQEARGVEDLSRRNTKAGRDEERGRQNRPKEEAGRSRSRSRQPAILRGADQTYNPLWAVPEVVDFDFPPNTHPSESLLTYDPNHPSLSEKDALPVEGVWLPVSEYVRVLNGILRGHDWELVSYVLTFLPLQLSNKVFFHGARATREVRALLDVLCEGVMTGSTWEKRFNVPPFIRKIDLNAAAYQCLSVLVSYRGIFDRNACDRLIQAFKDGLQGKSEVAKPCLQALTLAIYELEQHVGRHLLSIIESMNNILSTTGLAVHILEFLIAIGQNGNLYRNFTDEQYRLVFVVAINYIADHNARSDTVIDLSDPTKKEDFILSQHVIGLAYHSIYTWFMVLKLHQRPNLVPEITRELNKAKSKRSSTDEMAEVCFDWLARYAYGNADPKPATSFLSEMIMEKAEDAPAKSQSWLLGGAIITITTHARSGWGTINTTRPTGSTMVVCKLENIPLLELGEAAVDLVSLPAVLMANRTANANDGAEEVLDAKSSQPTQAFDANSQHGFIWSGATPSQRRKDVVIEPSYLALQLLSSYPNASLETPRGRLIPKEDRFDRALRGIQNTPVIDSLKIGVLYIGPGQTTEEEILQNTDGSPAYLHFLSGLGRLIRLRGQVDVFVGGLDRNDDEDGEYAYAWWDDFSQLIFHAATMMPNKESAPNGQRKKSHIGNDFVKIIYNDSGGDFAFDTIRTAFNFINIVISPFSTGANSVLGPSSTGQEQWEDWDREQWFKVTVQRAPGIPDFSPIGTHKLVSRRALPILVRHVAHFANDMAARFMHIQNAPDAASAEYITMWRSRFRAMQRLRQMLPVIELPDAEDEAAREQLLRDFTRSFSYQNQPDKE
nr:tuberin [Naematelia aurantialba]